MNTFTKLSPADRELLIAFLVEGNTIEDLAEMFLETQSKRELAEMLKEARELED